MEKETSRVEALGDGVLAIALTLLIFGVKVPDFDNSASSDNLFRAFVNLWPSYCAFILSFAAVLMMWINHHGFFNALGKSTQPFCMPTDFFCSQ